MYYRFVAATILLIVAMGCVQQPAQTVSTVSPEESLEILRKGAALHDQHKYAEAIAVYKNLLLRDPNNAQALYEMAYSYAANQQLEKALETVEKSLEASKDLLMPYVLKGNCLDDMGKPKQAIRVYRKGLKVHPDSYLLYYNMGYTLVRMKQLDKAENAFEHASVLNPDHPTSQLFLSRIWAGKNMRVQAIFANMRFLSLEPTSSRAKLAVTELRNLLSSGVSKTKDGTNINMNLNNLLGKKNAYTDLNMMLSLSAALVMTKDKSAGKTDLERTCYQLGSLYGMMAERQAQANDFAWKYYSDYYRQLADQKLVMPMCMIALQSMAPDEARKWEDSHKDKMEAFQQWNRSYKFPKSGLF